jgi:hypothetical protein
MTLLRSTIATVLAFVASAPLFLHNCGLSSRPLEVVLLIAGCGGSFAFTYIAKRQWVAWSLVVALPLLSGGTAFGYVTWLHSESFPEALLDQSGREWRANTRDVHRSVKLPNKAPEPTTLLVMPRAEPRVTPSRVVAHL